MSPKEKPIPLLCATCGKFYPDTPISGPDCCDKPRCVLLGDKAVSKLRPKVKARVEK